MGIGGRGSAAAGLGRAGTKVEVDGLRGLVPGLRFQSQTPFGFDVMIPI